MTTPSALVKLRDGRILVCVLSLSREYYYVVALTENWTSSYPKDWTSGPQNTRIIVHHGKDWLVTTESPDDQGIKSVWVRCENLEYAKRMRDA